MSDDKPAAGTTPEKYNFTAELISRLTSMKFALAVLLVIALACVAGTLFPQGSEVMQYLQKHPESEKKMELLGKLGLTNTFYAWWFISLLCILAANLAFCVTRRLGILKTTTGQARMRATGTMLIHLSLLIIFAGGVIRGIWSEKGTIAFHTGETADSFATDDGPRQLPFTVKLLNFEVERYPAQKTEPAQPTNSIVEKLDIYWPERDLQASLQVARGVEQVLSPDGPVADPGRIYRITVVQHVADFAIDLQTREVTSKSDVMNNPAIQVHVAGPGIDTKKWLFGKFPDFDMHAGNTNPASMIPFKMFYNVSVPQVELPRIKSFKSSLQIIEGATVAREKTIEVNSPLSHKGYSFFQTGYNENDLTWTSLQVVRDPSVPVVYLGFLLMIAGLLITTCRGMMAQPPQ